VGNSVKAIDREAAVAVEVVALRRDEAGATGIGDVEGDEVARAEAQSKEEVEFWNEVDQREEMVPPQDAQHVLEAPKGGNEQQTRPTSPEGVKNSSEYQPEEVMDALPVANESHNSHAEQVHDGAQSDDQAIAGGDFQIREVTAPMAVPFHESLSPHAQKRTLRLQDENFDIGYEAEVESSPDPRLLSVPGDFPDEEESPANQVDTAVSSYELLHETERPSEYSNKDLDSTLDIKSVVEDERDALETPEPSQANHHSDLHVHDEELQSQFRVPSGPLEGRQDRNEIAMKGRCDTPVDNAVHEPDGTTAYDSGDVENVKDQTTADAIKIKLPGRVRAWWERYSAPDEDAALAPSNKFHALKERSPTSESKMNLAGENEVIPAASYLQDLHDNASEVFGNNNAHAELLEYSQSYEPEEPQSDSDQTELPTCPQDGFRPRETLKHDDADKPLQPFREDAEELVVEGADIGRPSQDSPRLYENNDNKFAVEEESSTGSAVEEGKLPGLSSGFGQDVGMDSARLEPHMGEVKAYDADLAPVSHEEGLDGHSVSDYQDDVPELIAPEEILYSNQEDDTSVGDMSDSMVLASPPRIHPTVSPSSKENLRAAALSPQHEYFMSVTEDTDGHQYLHSTSDYLLAGDSTTDSESLAFVTPMQSAGFASPPPYNDRDRDDVSSHYAEDDDHNIWKEERQLSHTSDGQHSPQAENATTVHGQDDLFEDDYDSEEEPEASGSTIMVSHERLIETPETEPSVKEQIIEHIIEHGQDRAGNAPKTAVLTPGETCPTQANEPGIESHGGSGEPIAYGLATSTEETAYSSHSTPQMVSQTGGSSDVSPLSLRYQAPLTPSRGLAHSRWNPNRPETTPPMPEDEPFSADAFMPRDVTNIPWHERNDSIPLSLHSQSTLSSSPSSPIHSSLPIDSHEPVIRDSWHAPIGTPSRPRNNSNLTDRAMSDDYDPFRFDAGPKAIHNPNGMTISIGSPGQSHRNSVSNTSPGSLFQKMRSIFENPPPSESTNTSPVRSRPVSGIFVPVRRARQSISTADDSNGPHADSRRGGYLIEHEDEIDERSALLQSEVGGLEAN
jgi:hypothetical protein